LVAVHQRSGGTPRVINSICDNALFEAFLLREQTIGQPLILRVADNLGLQGAATTPAQHPTPASRPVGTPKVDLAEIDRYHEGLGKL
ncbi:MAG TPA: AAA family ATPase, partial [Cystobacter sp.]